MVMIAVMVVLKVRYGMVIQGPRSNFAYVCVFGGGGHISDLILGGGGHKTLFLSNSLMVVVVLKVR